MKALTIGIFLGILALTLAVTWWAARHTNTTVSYTHLTLPTKLEV